MKTQPESLVQCELAAWLFLAAAAAVTLMFGSIAWRALIALRPQVEKEAVPCRL